MKLPADVAVYAELSNSRKSMEPDWNTRVFNQVQIQEGSNIQLNQSSGVITVRAGLYHITGSSQVTYGDYGGLDPDVVLPKGEGWPTLVVPNGGYCRLRHAKDAGCLNEQAIVVGTLSNANMVPSLFDTILDVPEQTELVLEHQNGPRVSGIYLQDNAVNSPWHIFAQISLRRIGDSATAHQQSSLCRAFNAALGSYLADPEPYRRLYASYLGVSPKFAPTPEPCQWPAPSGAALGRVLKSGVLRFGYAEGAPYVYPAANGELAGIDWELGNTLTTIIRDQYFYFAPGMGLRAQWVPVKIEAGSDPEAARFDALAEGLKEGRFDVALSGQANISSSSDSPSMRDVDWTTSTALLFTNILYTGLDRYDLSGLVGTTRERFVARVKEWPEVKLMCVVNPGPSQTNSKSLTAAINDAGGHASLDTGTLEEMMDAINSGRIHFSVGDAIASSWIGNESGFQGLNLDIAAATKPLQTAQPLAAFVLKER